MDCNSVSAPAVQFDRLAPSRGHRSRTTLDSVQPHWAFASPEMAAPQEVDLHVVSNMPRHGVSRTGFGSGKAGVEEERMAVGREMLQQAAAAGEVLFLCECVGQLLRLDGENA